MSKIITILLFPLMLLSETAMKCEAGKCGSADASMSNKVPPKPIRVEKPTVEQLFNVKTTQVKTMITSRKQVNYGYLVAEDSRKIDIHAWFSGYVTKLFADTLYKKVEKGDALAQVYSPEVYQSKQDYLHSLEFNAKRPSPQMLQSAKIKLRLLGVSDEEIKRIEVERKVNELTTIYAPQSGWIF